MNFARALQTQSDSRSAESGAAMMELALVLPVLLVIFFASFELTRILQIRTTMSMFSHNAANLVFSDCLELDTLTAGGGQAPHIQDCVRDKVQQLAQQITLIAPGLSLVVSVYIHTPGGGVVEYGRYTEPSPLPPSVFQSQYSVAGGPGVNENFPEFFEQLGKVVIAEVGFRYVPIVYVPLSLQLYDVAIY